jgi:hypothetical protein
MNFGGDYGFKDDAESIILSAAPTESIILSAHVETIILSADGAESIILINPGNQGLSGADKQGRYLLLQILHKIT